MKSFSNNEEAISVTVSYVLFSIIFMVFFMMILLSANDLLVQGPSNIVVKAEFDDIGNLMGSSITDMYLIAPENGIINTSYRIPSSIGKEPYIIDIIQNSDAADEIIEVSSSVSDKKVNVTLNGMSEIGVNGTAYSSMSSHRIIYDSKNNNS